MKTFIVFLCSLTLVSASISIDASSMIENLLKSLDVDFSEADQVFDEHVSRLSDIIEEKNNQKQFKCISNDKPFDLIELVTIFLDMNNKFNLVNPAELLKTGIANLKLTDNLMQNLPEELATKLGGNPLGAINGECDALELLWESFEKGYDSMPKTSKTSVKEEYRKLLKGMKSKSLMEKFSDVIVFANQVLMKDLVTYNTATFLPNSNKSKNPGKATHNEL